MTTEVLKWMQVSDLVAVAAIFAAISFGGYLTIHELKEKDVKKIQKKRVQLVRAHLSALIKKCEQSEVNEEMETQFFELFQNE